jgi:hypothetical protein
MSYGPLELPYTLGIDYGSSNPVTKTNSDGSVTTTYSDGHSETIYPSFGDVLLGALVSGVKTIVNLLFTKGVILAILLFFVDFVITLFLELIGSFLKMSDLSDMINQLPNKDLMGYFFYLGAVDYGLPLILAAYLLKFFIRRLPFVG